MKCYYRALLDVYEEMEQEMAKEGKLYCVHYTKELVWHQITFLLDPSFLHDLGPITLLILHFNMVYVYKLVAWPICMIM